MEIKEAQKLVRDRLERIGYTKIETTPVHAFLHLIEEIGEAARTLLHEETKRKSLPITTEPSGIEDEISYFLADTETVIISQY